MRTVINGNDPSLPRLKRQPSPASSRQARCRRKTVNPTHRKPGKAQAALCRVVQTEPARFYILKDASKAFIPPNPAPQKTSSEDLVGRARVIITVAAVRAAALSGGLALPVGPFGLLTIVPDLLGIWKIHNQMVADIAAVYGKRACLTQDQLARCLLKHGACQLARGVIVRLGEWALVRRASLGLLLRVGVPILGAAAVAAYAYFDTVQIGNRAIALLGEPLKGGQKTGSRCRRNPPEKVQVNGTRAARGSKTGTQRPRRQGASTAKRETHKTPSFGVSVQSVAAFSHAAALGA